MSALELAEGLQREFGDLISPAGQFRGEVNVLLADAERVADVCGFARKSIGIDYLVDITSIDNYGDDLRWLFVYHLYSYAGRAALRLKTLVSEEKSELPSVTGIWRTADWHEREIYDMMASAFEGIRICAEF